VSTTALENTSLCTLQFRVSAATPETGSALTLKSIRLYDETGTSVPATAEKGSISRSTARLTLSRERTVESRSVRMTVRLEGELSPAGGNFTMQYDPDCLQLTSVLKLHPAVELLTWNEPQPGTVHVRAVRLDRTADSPELWRTVGWEHHIDAAVFGGRVNRFSVCVVHTHVRQRGYFSDQR